ncbi:MAG: hypothetical protein HY000_10365 [Planctomycetes bacterium]|nr:hypothetical protein [Planctomycetota bacterium]
MRFFALTGLVAVVVGCSKSPGSHAASQPTTLAPLPALSRPTGNIDEMIDQAKEAADKGDYDQAIETLENAVMLDATHRTVLLLLTHFASTRSKAIGDRDPDKAHGLILKSGGYLRMLRGAHKDFTDEEKRVFAQVFYDEACAHARLSLRDETLASLREARAAGFDELDRLRTDASFVTLLDLPSFQKLLEEWAASAQNPGRRRPDGSPYPP